MKLFICGPPRHGKDTVAEIIRENYGLSFESSSYFCMRQFLRDVLEQKYGLKYSSFEECYADRYHHRKKWHDEIRIYNDGDLSRLSRELFEHYDVYVGIRNREEYLAARHLSDLSIWVDASTRLKIGPGESAFSDLLVQPSDCDVTIRNDQDVTELRWKIYRLFENFVPLLDRERNGEYA